MTPSIYQQLRHGLYEAPKIDIGSLETCELRDCDVIVVGYSDGRIPWPVGRRPGTGAKTLVILGALADAVRKESASAICYCFGPFGAVLSSTIFQTLPSPDPVLATVQPLDTYLSTSPHGA